MVATRPDFVMSRPAVLSSLIQFDAPVADIKAAIASYSWDDDPIVTLVRRDIVSVLERFASGEIDAVAVEEWANLVECREDIAFEPGYEETIMAAIFDLANPKLQGRLANLTPDLLSRLS
jgi:hypothetical protein